MRKTAYNSVQFSPGEPGNIATFPDILRYIRDLEVRIELAVTTLAAGRYEKQFAPPEKPRDGAVYYADGTMWDPGAGRGFYYYDADNAMYQQLG